MRKFVIYTRAIPGCCRPTGTISIVEVECEMLTAMQDPSVMWGPPGEYRVRILKPEFLHETQKVLNGNVEEKITVPSIYYNHALYESVEAAVAPARSEILAEFEFQVRKNKRSSFTTEEVEAKCAEINVVLLP